MIAQLIENGVVVNSIVLPDGATIASDGASASWAGGSYAAPSGATLMSQAGAGVGWELVGGVLVAPVAATPAPTPAVLLAYANSKVSGLLAIARAYALTGGVSVKADATATTNADLLGLASWGAANPTATMPWVDNFGVVTSITGAEAVALGQAVLTYSQSVYAVLATVATGIAGGTVTTTAEIDAAAWPA